MLEDTKMFRSKMGAFTCIAYMLAVAVLGYGRFRCLLRSDWVIAQHVRQNRLDIRTGCNSF